MRKLVAKTALFVMVAVILLFGSIPNLAQAKLADGTYTIDYTVMHGSDPSASIANDYWEKPATLYVKNGNITAQMGLNHSSWIVGFKTPSNGGFSDVTVISENETADTSVVQFLLSGIEAMTEAKIHVIVPDIEYDHDYTIRFDFDENSLQSQGDPVEADEDEASSNEENEKDGEPLGTTQPPEDNSKTTDTNTSNTNEDNPQTNDASPVVWLAGLAIVSAIVLLRKRVRQA